MTTLTQVKTAAVDLSAIAQYIATRQEFVTDSRVIRIETCDSALHVVIDKTEAWFDKHLAERIATRVSATMRDLYEAQNWPLPILPVIVDEAVSPSIWL